MEKDFKEYYKEKLLPELNVLEEERKLILKKLSKLALILGSILIAGIVLFFLLENPFIAIFLGLILIGIYFFMQHRYSKGYHHGFKTKVISVIVKFIDQNLTFDHTNKISEAEFSRTKIFKQHRDRYSGEDLVYGKLEKTDIRFSEVHAEYKTTSVNSKGQTTTTWHTIFKGILFIADFNKSFQSEVFVLPDTAEKLFGKWGQNLQALNKSHGNLVKLEDPEFEKAFAIYGSDQVEARYLLSTSLMERILTFKKKTKSNIYLSFVDSRLHVGITLNKDLFEARLRQTLLDFDYIKTNLDYFLLFTGIVHDLNLNRRIWGKE